MRPSASTNDPTGPGARITVSGDATGSPAGDVDRRLIERLAAGELEALNELYERHKTMAFSIAFRVTGDGAAAEDAVQDAFLGAWRGAGRYEAGRSSVRTWLLTIVRRRAIDTVRRRRHSDANVELNETAAESLAGPDVWDDVARGLDRGTVLAALAQISVPQRQAIELAYFEGLTQVEIALRTGVPLGTVKGRLRLGLLGLRRAITGVGSAADVERGETGSG